MIAIISSTKPPLFKNPRDKPEYKQGNSAADKQQPTVYCNVSEAHGKIFKDRARPAEQRNSNSSKIHNITAPGTAPG